MPVIKPSPATGDEIMSEAGQREVALVNKFLEERHAHAICEICADNKWVSVDSNFDPLKALVPITPGGMYSTPKTGSGIIAYVFICTNCGNIRLHSRAIIEAGIPELGRPPRG